MTRGFVSLLTVLLLASVPGVAQFGIPGVGYPGGRSRRYPQGGPQAGRQPDNSASTLVGMLRKIGDKDVIIESDDKAIVTISIANSTKYLSTSGSPAHIGDFQPGDHVSVSAKKDSKGVYHASSMTMVWEGTPDEHAAASHATDDLSHPIMGTAPPASSSASAAASATASAASDDDHPRLRRPSSNADDSPKAQITPNDSTASPAPPVLRRASPPAASTPSPDPGPPIAEARPSLHADNAGTATRLPQRIPESGDPVIDKAREAAFEFTETLPNYVVKQFTTRYATAAARGGKTSWQTLDIVTADVIEEDGAEKYKNILVNGKPPVGGVEKSGSWSRGEFSSMQLDVLSPDTNANFHAQRTATIVNRAAYRYEFSVEQPNSHWHVEVESGAYMPGYTGSIWIDKQNYRVLRIEMSAQRLPGSFALDQVEWAVDYDYVFIGEGKYLLPAHSETLSCARATSQCTRNVIEFRNYRKFTADTSITFETDK